LYVINLTYISRIDIYCDNKKWTPDYQEVNIIWYMHDGAGWWAIFGGIFTILFRRGLICVTVRGISRLNGCNNNPEIKIPVNIARERYARGEISK